MNRVKYTGDVGCKYMTLLVNEGSKEFHSAYFSTVQGQDGKDYFIKDENAPFNMAEAPTKKEALKKAEEYLTRVEVPAKKLHYIKNLKDALEDNPYQFEAILKAIVESPYQSEHGDLWVDEPSATAILSDLYDMAMGNGLFDVNEYNRTYEEDEVARGTLLHVVD
ncbi:hypothetical protein [Bacillus sp. SM2101]|uniref:hypothetical protein n=1 Tax=Bacillus sp. SM2101 TaxID=2805366 RepID=UPI001BDE6793|nr:hypothetical protein [Bacillus sp. SM2101]